MRALCASVLLSEFMIIGLAALVAMSMTDLSTGALWAVSGTAMVLCLLLSGLAGRPGTVGLGWGLQTGLIASGFVVPVMFLIGAIFAALWAGAIHVGRMADAAKAAYAARMAQEANADPPGSEA